MIVVNLNERSEGGNDILKGAEAAKRDRGTEFERIRVGGEVAPMSQAPV